MLSNNTSWKQLLLDGSIFVENRTWRARAAHARNKKVFKHWLKVLANCLKKIEGNLGTLFTTMF